MKKNNICHFIRILQSDGVEDYIVQFLDNLGINRYILSWLFLSRNIFLLNKLKKIG